MLNSLIRRRTRYTPSTVKAHTEPVEDEAPILIYKFRANVHVPDCSWLTGFAESNGLAGRLIPQASGGYRALKWRDRGGYVDLGIFTDIEMGIRAIGAPKKV